MSASSVLMIRPVRFGYNAETAITNVFQEDVVQEDVQASALCEFNMLARLLANEGVNVVIINDTEQPHTPDSIFPNNWISFHEDGTIILYPMLAHNRRPERRPDIIEALKQQFRCRSLIDLSNHEQENRFLEGTGSIVFDHAHKIAYAALSPRTDRYLLTMLCEMAGYIPLVFNAADSAGVPVYHTNVVMCVGEQFAVVCLESIRDLSEREILLERLRSTGKMIVNITLQQVNEFAGNMYELIDSRGKHLLLMSSRAEASLTQEQKDTLNKFCRIVHSPLNTIERLGGGSARCMIADIRLPRAEG